MDSVARDATDHRNTLNTVFQQPIAHRSQTETAEQKLVCCPLASESMDSFVGWHRYSQVCGRPLSVASPGLSSLTHVCLFLRLVLSFDHMIYIQLLLSQFVIHWFYTLSCFVFLSSLFLNTQSSNRT